MKIGIINSVFILNKLKRKMQKAVGKQVAHNEETRMELEEPYKSLETEEEDVEK